MYFLASEALQSFCRFYESIHSKVYDRLLMITLTRSSQTHGCNQTKRNIPNPPLHMKLYEIFQIPFAYETK